MHTLILNPRSDPLIRSAPRSSRRPTSRRLDTHAQHPERTLAEGDLVQTARRAAEVAVRDERLRLARELHDSVAQTLYGIALSASRALTLLERSETEQVHTVVDQLLRLANDSQQELRALVHELRSDHSFQPEGGLTEALKSQAVQLQARTGCQVRLSLADEPDIAPSTKLTLFRIAREALHNSEKHAQATCVDLVLEVGPSEVTLLVADDGRGFDPYASHPGHFGLQLMCEQAMAIGAALELVSGPGRGTQVRVGVGRRR
jgi:signal transduction histidine kinase